MATSCTSSAGCSSVHPRVLLLILDAVAKAVTMLVAVALALALVALVATPLVHLL